MQVGIVLFVLIIVVGLIAGLCLSAPGPQRRAVAVAFLSMAVVAVLFYVFAMRGSYLWTAPLFAVACIAIPIGSYAALMKSQDAVDKGVTRRNPVEVPRADLPEGVSRPLRSSSPLESSVMPVTPSHPVNEFQELGGYQEFDEYQDSGAYQGIYLEEDDFELVEDMEAPGLSSPMAELPVDIDEDDFELAEDMDEPEIEMVEEDDEDELDLAEPPVLVASNDGAEFPPLTQEPVPSLPLTPAEQLLDEALMEENADRDESGLFEPEMMPDPHAADPSTAVTSTSVVAVPGEEGDEQFLVVSESTTAPNPLMAYKRSTSSHLVPLGSPEPDPDMPVQNVPPQPEPRMFVPAQPTPPAPIQPAPMRQAPAPPVQPAPQPAVQAGPGRERIELAREAELASPASTAVIMSVVSRELDAMRQPEALPDGFAAEAQPSLFDQPPVEAEVPFYEEPAAVAEDLFGAFEPEPAVAYTPYEPPVGNPPEVVEAAMIVEAEPAFAPAPKPARQPKPKPKASFSYQPLVIEQPVEQPAPAPAPTAAPEPEPAPEPAPELTPFERAASKADTLRDRELYPVAARLYAQAAAEAPTNDERRRMQFEEIMCYLKAGQNEKARELAAQLRSSSVLTRVERIKLDAIERMG